MIVVINLCKQILDVIDFALISAVLIILCMMPLAQIIIFDEMEELEKKINRKILRINKKINKD